MAIHSTIHEASDAEAAMLDQLALGSPMIHSHGRKHKVTHWPPFIVDLIVLCTRPLEAGNRPRKTPSGFNLRSFRPSLFPAFNYCPIYRCGQLFCTVCEMEYSNPTLKRIDLTAAVIFRVSRAPSTMPSAERRSSLKLKVA